MRAPARLAHLRGQQAADPLTHAVLCPSLNALAVTCLLAEASSTAELLQTRSDSYGGEINSFAGTHKSTDDLLVVPVDLPRKGPETGFSGFIRCSLR